MNTLAPLLDLADLIVRSRLKALCDWVDARLKELADEDQTDYFRIFRGGVTEVLMKLGNRTRSEVTKDLKAAAREYLRRAFESGYLETSGIEDPREMDEDALNWIADRIKEESGYITQMVKDTAAIDTTGMQKSEILAIAEARAEGYLSTLRAVYAQGKLFGNANQLLTWHYGDTEHCETCKKLNGTRHRAKWYIKKNYIPGKPGAEMDCGGYRCQCYLTDKRGEVFTI